MCGLISYTKKANSVQNVWTLHALTAHSPTQYESACVCSLNTENQERLFGQARGIADACTNHHAENLIPQIMIRLQAKQEQRTALLSVEKADTQVASVAKHLPKLPDTMVKKSFIQHRESSWQLHLKRISPFLMSGEGGWWTHAENGFRFFDGDSNPTTPNEPSLLHFRCHTVKDVEQREKCWAKTIKDYVVIPADSIKLYDSDGKLTGKLLYKDGEVIHQQHPSNSTNAASDNDSVHSSPSTAIPQQETPTNPPTLEDLMFTSDLAGDFSLTCTQEESHSVLPLTHIHVHVSEDTPESARETQPSPAPKESSHHQSTHIILTTNSEEHHDSFKSTLAASIANIIECDATLREFDELRSILKEAKSKNRPNNLRDKVVRYNTLTAKLSLQILARRTELDTAIKAFEQKYFIEHSKLPKREPAYMELLKERNYAKAALRAMNVSL